MSQSGIPTGCRVCQEENRLQKISQAVEGSLGLKAAAYVGYFQPDAFITHIKTLRPPPTKVQSAPEIRRGYKIKRTYIELSPEELKAREDAALKMLAEAMRRKPKRRDG